jgi:starch synthase
MKVLFVGAELNPIVKIGGLADVLGSLPKALEKKGIDCEIVIPFYSVIDQKKIKAEEKLMININYRGNSQKVIIYQCILSQSKIKVTLLKNEKYLSSGQVYFSRSAFCDSLKEARRFEFFSITVDELIKKKIFSPDLVHCHDWHIGSLVRMVSLPTLFTIHNLANQGKVGNGPNYLELGIKNATLINTVSPTYAEEILSPSFSEGLTDILQKRKNDLSGILNGIDYEVFNPAEDKEIYSNYDFRNIAKKVENKLRLEKDIGLKSSDKIPLLAIISRLTRQKGIDLAIKSLNKILKKDVYLIVLGMGEKKLEDGLKDLKKPFSEKTSLHFEFNAPLAQKIYAASDIFLMPSRFEPCGLGQMIAMRYGTIPVARKTGGLSDTIQNGKNGFLFRGLKSDGLYKKILEALDLYKNKSNWQKIIKNAMDSDFSWDKSAQKYLRLYKLAIKKYDRN